jgi:hypothetical protein
VIVSSYHHLVSPLVAAGALGVIMLMCRWVFSTTTRDERTARRLALARARGDYGLLVTVARVRTAADAQMLREVLGEAGIRCTVAEDGSAEDGGAVDVLVFRSDAGRARDLVGSSSS